MATRLASAAAQGLPNNSRHVIEFYLDPRLLSEWGSRGGINGFAKLFVRPYRRRSVGVDVGQLDDLREGAAAAQGGEARVRHHAGPGPGAGAPAPHGVDHHLGTEEYFLPRHRMPFDSRHEGLKYG